MKRITILALTIGLMALAASSAMGVGGYLSDFTTAYPAKAATALNSCTLCHAGSPSGGNVNSFGNAYANAGYVFAAVEALDSDGDGFTNIAEINANTFPGDAASKPAVTGDAVAPTVSTFTIPATATSLTVSVSAFTATDNVGVTGYLITESATAPAAGAAGWSATAPASYTFATAGAKTLYAWAKDAAGNVSTSRSASVTVTVAVSDTTLPTVSTFTIPATASSLSLSITSLVATDNTGVTGYMITESATKPAAGAAGWSATPPASYLFSSGGAKTLYAWAKDAAGNVSNSRSATTTVTVSINTHVATIGVFSAGSWYFDADNSAAWSGTAADTMNPDFGKGLPNVMPVTGDWDGTGAIRIGVFSNGAWYLDMNGNGSWDGEQTDKIIADFGKGLPGALPVVGDWNGSGISKVGIFWNGSWYLDVDGDGAWNPSFDTHIVDFGKGLPGALPVVGDWNGSGISKVGIFHNGSWYLDMNNNGIWEGEVTDKMIPDFGKGLPGAAPASGDWNGSGIAKVGIFWNGSWYLDMNNNGIWEGEATDKMIPDFGKGLPSVIPIVK